MQLPQLHTGKPELLGVSEDAAAHDQDRLRASLLTNMSNSCLALVVA